MLQRPLFDPPQPSVAPAERLFVEGRRHMASGAAWRAERCFRAALAARPRFAEAHANLGLVLEARGRPVEAEQAYHAALEWRPDLAAVHLNLGALLAAGRRHDEAAASYVRAITLEPESPAGWSNLGALCAGLKRDADAEALCRQALALDPHFAKARFNLAYVLLRQGRFKEGWHCLEARDWYSVFAARLSRPRWQGESLAGRSLLLCPEAGHGDVIQFCRYAALLKAQGPRRLGLLCQPALKSLLSTLDGVDDIIGFDDALAPGDWDVWAPLLSLPHLLQTRLETIPSALPYLHAAPRVIERWRPRLPAAEAGELRVGLVWKGNPKFEHDAERSLPHLALLEPLGRVAGVRLVSLQKGAGEAEAREPPPGLSLVPLGDAALDFADTAAILAQLDLVISVDTAVAHLAGALGVPCWVLLAAHMTDWRWLEGRADSPWYPGVMRLFRQQRAGDWDGVVAEVAAALTNFGPA